VAFCFEPSADRILRSLLRRAGRQQVANGGLAQAFVGVLAHPSQQAIDGASQRRMAKLAGTAGGEPTIGLGGLQDVVHGDLFGRAGEPIATLEAAMGDEDASIPQHLQDLAHVAGCDASSGGDIAFAAPTAGFGDVHHGPYGVLAGQTEHAAIPFTLGP
jgi:hypothetical protein